MSEMLEMRDAGRIGMLPGISVGYKYTSVLGQDGRETKGVDLLSGSELSKGRLEIQKRKERYEVGY